MVWYATGSKRYYELVLDAISDDPETVPIILQTINEWDNGRDPETWAARSAVPVSRPEVIRALRELIREGYAQAFIFLGNEAHPVDFRENAVQDVWFSATKKGIDAVKQFLAKGEEEL